MSSNWLLKLGVSVPLPPLKSQNPALTLHFPGLYLNTVPRGSIQNNIPFDAFVLAQINPCMICINDTHLVIWRNALIFRTCWKTQVNQKIYTKISLVKYTID